MKTAFALIFLALTFGAEAKNLTVKTSARGAILYNPNTGAILYEKRAHDPHYPASTTKLATALYALEGKGASLADELLASEEALVVINADIKQEDPLKFPPHILEHDGVSLGINPLERLSTETLLHGLLLFSSCDAGNVIAEHYGGTVPQFMREVNAFFKKKGLKQTHFLNPHGLHHPAQMTTPYEMALIASWSFENPQLASILNKQVYTSETRTIQNHNRLIREGKKYSYPHAIGAKTGYIGLAGYNLVAAAEKDGRRLIAVVFGCPTSNDRYEDAIALFEAAFREQPKKRKLISAEHETFRRTLSSNDTLEAKPVSDLDLTYFPSEETELSAKILWEKLDLPVKKGDPVGEIVVTNAHDKTLATCPLRATTDHKASLPKRMRWPLIFTGIAMLAFLSRRLAKKAPKNS